ncbi:MAG: EAL domain-containing protein [Sulfuricaulis sp.]
MLLSENNLRAGLAIKITGIVFWGLIVFGIALVFFLSRNLQREEIGRHEAMTDHLALQVQTILLKNPQMSATALAVLINKLSHDQGLAAAELRPPGAASLDVAPRPGLMGTEREITLTTGDVVILSVYYPVSSVLVEEQRKKLLLTLGGLFLVFGFIMQWILQRILTQPFLRMVETAEAISHGDKTCRFDQDRPDEFGFLATFINKSLDFLAQQMLEQKRAADALRASDAHLRAIIDAEPECVKIVDAHGKLLQMNAAGLAMIEVDSADQVIGKSVLGIISPEHRESFHEFSESVIRGNKGMLEFEIVSLKGTHRWLKSHAVPLKNSADGETLLLSVTRDITEHKLTEERLSYLAHYDSLTGLPNRALFYDRLQQATIEANRHERIVGIMFLDLDRFKNINDSLGHHMGDMLLKAVAKRLNEAVRKGDTIARLSGDEFTLVLADMGHVDDAIHMARKILNIFSQPFCIEGRELFITASIGITLYPSDDNDVNGLLRNADVAMYRAKESGGNSYQFYTSEMTTRALEHLELESDLRHALERNEFALHYQPIVDGVTGRIIGMEALLRWNHLKRGLIPPGQFIPLAEDSGMILPIGEWVLRTACAQCLDWQKQGFPTLYVAVNISARQFHQANLAEVVAMIIRETGLAPDHLELEITESIIMRKADATVTTLQQLNAMGVKFSIDDFGTGYSSLSYLKRFPIDAIKIDQSFVRDIPDDSDNAAIATAIITMAHSLGIRAIAEGVETREQLDFLRGRLCDSMQGYYFSRPVPVEEFKRLLREGNISNSVTRKLSRRL